MTFKDSLRGGGTSRGQQNGPYSDFIYANLLVAPVESNAQKCIHTVLNITNSTSGNPNSTSCQLDTQEIRVIDFGGAVSRTRVKRSCVTRKTF